MRFIPGCFIIKFLNGGDFWDLVEFNVQWIMMINDGQHLAGFLKMDVNDGKMDLNLADLQSYDLGM